MYADAMQYLETPYHKEKREKNAEASRIRKWKLFDLILFAVLFGLVFYLWADIAIASNFNSHNY